MKNKKKRTFLRRFSAICILLFAISAILYAFSLVSYQNADLVDRYIGHNLRHLLSALTSPFPFSLGEGLIVLALLFFVPALFFALRRISARRVLCFVLCLMMLFSSAFLLVLGVAYRKTPLAERLSVTPRPVDKEELEAAARILLAMLHEELPHIAFDADGSSVMPYGLDSLSERLSESYRDLARQGIVDDSFSSRVKGVALSVPMSYLQILGVYFFFTGEANINMDYPDVERPFTAAHELAHQHGVARENEASMVAFLASRASDDAYIRYSCALGVFRYVISALYSADSDLYFALLEDMDPRIRTELSELSRHARKYSGNLLGEVSGELNDAYLKANGTEGEISYGLIVDLSVAYLLSHPDT